MGARKTRRADFLARNPLCCFCGGLTQASTEDHIPARALFFRRGWPEGYVFPACGVCNGHSAEDELFMAFLVRVTVRPTTLEESTERQKAIAGIKARHPDFFPNFKKLSRNEFRRRAHEIGGLGQFGIETTSVTMVSMPPLAMEVATRYGQKLGKALHYRHTEEILPNSGDTWAWVMTNAVIPALEIPAELFGPLTSAPKAKVRRGSVDLDYQFSYRYLIVEEGLASCFLVTLGQSMTILVVALRFRGDIASSPQGEGIPKFFNEAALPGDPLEI